MRKLLALSLFLSVPLTGLAYAAPAPQCNHFDLEKVKEKDKDGKDVDVYKIENGNYVVKGGGQPIVKNCFAGEIFVLDGDQKITITEPAKPAVPGTPTTPPMPAVPATTKEADLVECKVTGVTIDPKDCAMGKFAEQFNGGGIEPVAEKALEQIKAKVPNAQYDEIVLFSSDFGPAVQPGPLFFRAQNAERKSMNDVANLAPGNTLPVVPRDPNKPYVGLINAGNIKTIKGTPSTGAYEPCGRAPRRPVDDPVITDQPAGALCAPALYTYFDALAQATANIYGPFLGVDPRYGTNFSTMPAIKSALVETGTMGLATSKFPVGGLVTNVWNAFLDTQGSILGGNTWRDSGNGTFSVTRPPAFHGVSAPFEGGQVLRFTPMDLYVMGFLPAAEVPAVQSLMNANAAMVFQPAVPAFNVAVGPNMGTRISGVAVRVSANALGPVPRSIPFNEIAGFNGGERVPNAAAAPQYIRQLWVMVTEPKKVIDAVVAAAPAADKEKQPLTELREQITEIEQLQRFRTEYNRYFYTLTGYRGRLLSHTEPNVDDMGYWEFGDSRDDAKELTAGGGLEMRIPGPTEILNSGGKQSTSLLVLKTNSSGTVTFAPVGRTVKISGKSKSSAVNNLLTIRMRLPEDAGLKDKLRGKIVFQGPQGEAAIEFPTDEKAFLLPDGVYHNYSIDLTKTPFAGDKEYSKFVLYPAIGDVQEVGGLEIELIRVSWTPVANLKDSDKGCAKEDSPDSWLDLEDNCKALHNPDQADGNGDGVGDACEDYDGDNVVNRCDNCPTVTNSSQRNGNSNDLGDACDGDKPSDCFFQTSTVGGPVSPTSAVVWATGLILGAIVTTAVRRRRRRR